jgi:hypothetical protein
MIWMIWKELLPEAVHEAGIKPAVFVCTSAAILMMLFQIWLKG